MPDFSAKDVQSSARPPARACSTAKRALEENDGDMDKATLWLREQGLASQAKRADREASEGAVAIGAVGRAAAIVAAAVGDRLRGQVDEFVALVASLAEPGGRQGRGGRRERADESSD